MRATQTITPVEQISPAQQRLISATDSSGKITYCNDELTKISGYSREELVGSPHKLVRHPDMPAALFGMIWRYLKAGKSWMGTQQIHRGIETLNKGADDAVSIARHGIREADHGVEHVIKAQGALQGIRQAVNRINGMS